MRIRINSHLARVVSFLILGIITSLNAQNLVVDYGFEGGNQPADEHRTACGELNPTREIAREGQWSLQVKTCGGRGDASNRSEIYYARHRFNPDKGDDIWSGWSTYVPQNASAGGIMWQDHNGAHRFRTPYNWTIDRRKCGGHMGNDIVRSGNGDGYTVKIAKWRHLGGMRYHMDCITFRIPMSKGRWEDWVVREIPSHGNDGLIQVWKDGVLHVNHRGPNQNPILDINTLKMGVYGGQPQNERLTYIDAIRVGLNASYDAVAPRGAPPGDTPGNQPPPPAQNPAPPGNPQPPAPAPNPPGNPQQPNPAPPSPNNPANPSPDCSPARERDVRRRIDRQTQRAATIRRRIDTMRERMSNMDDRQDIRAIRRRLRQARSNMLETRRRINRLEAILDRVACDRPANGDVGDITFILIDANADQPIGEITDGKEFDLGTMPGNHLAVEVKIPNEMESTRIIFDREAVVESFPPYTSFGDSNNGTDYQGRDLGEGTYTVMAMTYARNLGRGPVVARKRVVFSLVGQSNTDNPASPPGNNPPVTPDPSTNPPGPDPSPIPVPTTSLDIAQPNVVKRYAILSGMDGCAGSQVGTATLYLNPANNAAAIGVGHEQQQETGYFEIRLKKGNQVVQRLNTLDNLNLFQFVASPRLAIDIVSADLSIEVATTRCQQGELEGDFADLDESPTSPRPPQNPPPPPAPPAPPAPAPAPPQPAPNPPPGGGGPLLELIDFETGNFNQWRNPTSGSSMHGVVRSPVCGGSFAGRWTSDGSRTESAAKYFPLNTDLWYGWALFIPDGYCSNCTGTVTQPIHGFSRQCTGPIGNMSIMHLRIERNNWVGWFPGFPGNVGGKTTFGPVRKGRWTQFVINAKLTPNNDGYIRIWIDGQQVTNREGRTWQPDCPTGPYFKMGTYAGVPRGEVIYGDEIRVGRSRAAVDPANFCR